LLDPAAPASKNAIDAFESAWAENRQPRLEGAFTFIRPTLGYNLRHWAGYSLNLPARQLDLVQPGSIAIILCLEADGGGKSYFFQRHDIRPPKLDDPAAKAAVGKLSIYFSGGFFAGPGRYRYRFMLADKDGRMYRHGGKFEVEGGRVPSSVPPGKALPMSSPQWTGFAADAKGGHATVMMHASPVFPRRSITRLQPYDRFVLLSALGTLLSQGGFSSAHVIVFDLAGRRVLFDEENFDRSAMRRLRRTLEEADFATIAYETLAHGPTPQRLAEDVLMRAAEKRDDREAVVFLGPAWRPSRQQQPIHPALKESLPKVHYLALVPRNFLPQDTINDVVRALKGKVHAIYAPSDFINALRKISSGG
jgi:hypothetical protein